MTRIEIFGVHGAGKSTLSAAVHRNSPWVELREAFRLSVADILSPPGVRRVARKLPESSLKNASRLSGLSNRGLHYYQYRHPESYHVSSKFLRRYTADADRVESVARSVLTHAEYYGTIGLTESSFDIFIDQGMLYRALSIFAPPDPTRPLNEDHLAEYARSQPLPDAMLVLEVDIETAEARMRHREEGYPRAYEHLSREEMLDRMRRARSCIDRLAEFMESNNREVIRVDARRSLSTTFDRVVESGLLDVDRYPNNDQMTGTRRSLRNEFD